ncbi:MAG TPA: hypothetical protein VNQ76_07370 [Planctomicrobium sp.]|nr:hypothetical protein [Planctomicrobium sp.]
MTKFLSPLQELAEGRTAPSDWLVWWSSHSEEIEALVSRGWYLRLKPRQVDPDQPNRAALFSQEGACYILNALDVPFEKSDRYHQVWVEEFRLYCEEQKALRKRLKKQYGPQLALLGKTFPGPVSEDADRTARMPGCSCHP